MPASDIVRDPEVAAVVDPNGTMTLYNLAASKGTTFNQGIIDSSDTDNEAQYTGIEMSFTTRLAGWCDDVRQLDGRPHAPAVVRHRRQPERADIDRAVQRERRDDGCRGIVRRPLLRSDAIRLSAPA